MKKIFTGYKDKFNKLIFVGQILQSNYGYKVKVCTDEFGKYYGKLICDINYSCRNIPYHLNKGKNHKIVKK